MRLSDTELVSAPPEVLNQLTLESRQRAFELALRLGLRPIMRGSGKNWRFAGFEGPDDAA